MESFVNRFQLGRVPRVAGTIITAEYLRDWAASPKPLPCDFVELRVDGFPDYPDWVEAGKRIEASGTPVFATVRLAKEGGFWKRNDVDRWPLLRGAIENLSGVDVELDSELLERVCGAAREQGKFVVASSHNFESTPSLGEMRAIVEKAHALGAIAKIAAKVNSHEDLANLREILRTAHTGPVCIIGMGELGRETRVTFPREGSCLTYGYLDTPGAPGQYSAQELTALLKTA
jgi:3-dehydroquinate dehydratase-1